VQINGVQLATLYSSKPEVQDKSRSPVTIDAKTFKVEVEPSPAKPQARITYGDIQQSSQAQEAQFVRVFAGTDDSFSAPSKQSSALALPKGVQEYLHTASLQGDDDSQTLLDEIV